MANDGKTSPFGNGNGGARGGGGAPSDLRLSPGGAGPSGPAPRDLTLSQVAPQRPGSDPVNADSVPEGGPLPFAQTDPAQDAGNPLGVGTPSDPRKPYRLDG